MRRHVVIPSRDFMGTFHNTFSVQPERLTQYVRRAAAGGFLIPARLLVHLSKETEVVLLYGNTPVHHAYFPADAWVDPKQCVNLEAILYHWRMNVY